MFVLIGDVQSLVMSSLLPRLVRADALAAVLRVFFNHLYNFLLLVHQEHVPVRVHLKFLILRHEWEVTKNCQKICVHKMKVY